MCIIRFCWSDLCTTLHYWHGRDVIDYAVFSTRWIHIVQHKQRSVNEPSLLACWRTNKHARTHAQPPFSTHSLCVVLFVFLSILQIFLQSCTNLPTPHHLCVWHQSAPWLVSPHICCSVARMYADMLRKMCPMHQLTALTLYSQDYVSPGPFNQHCQLAPFLPSFLLGFFHTTPAVRLTTEASKASFQQSSIVM